MTLKDLKPGKSAVVTEVGGEGALRQHFLDMGIIPGVEITVVKYAPMGDPVELMIHGYELTLRLDDARQILVKECEKKENQEDKEYTKVRREHPGFGEGGRYHSKEEENPVPEGTVLTFALVGNQNCGKTTLFNMLTGSNQHVGNFPGVTVDRKDGQIRGHKDTLVTDLPGIYSMSPYTSEELVSRDFVISQKPCAIINIVDATNIERNLYLTMQLLEMGIPMVLALNMMDEMRANGGTVDVNLMEQLLGIPVVPISAAKNEGVDELVNHAIHIAKYAEKPKVQDFCDEKEDGGAVHRGIHAVTHLIEDHAIAQGIPVRFAATKVIEGDNMILEKLGVDQNERETIEHIVLQMEKERGLDRSAAIASMRYSFVMKIAKACVKKPGQSKEKKRSENIDRILTGKYTAIPVFILIMSSIFILTFNYIGLWLQELFEKGLDKIFGKMAYLMEKADINEALYGLVVDGIFAGVGSVLSFMPIIVILFFFLSLLEDTGYMARVAFVMDRSLRKLGLSGRSIVPMLIGFGCTVPAIMATRTLPSERDRKMTMLFLPFMSCSAKLPIYAFIANAFFKENAGFVMVLLYLLGICSGVVMILIYKKTLFRGDAVPFVMELPNYRMPSAKNVFRLVYDKAKDFVVRAFSVILLATVVIWLLQSFDISFHMVDDPGESILGMIAGVIAPVLSPAGLGDWRIATALISGFLAKESVVSIIEMLYNGAFASEVTCMSAVSLLVFSLLYTPCVAAVSAVKRELGSKWAIGVVIWQCIVAWIVSCAVYNIGMLFFT